MHSLYREGLNPWLDITRSAAIFFVLVHHGQHYFNSSVLAEGSKFAGVLGVELFFVLSGFLIGHILFENTTTQNDFRWMKNFWIRRWLRTIPNYWLFILLNIAFVYFGFRGQAVPNVLPYLLCIQNLFFPHPEFFSEAWSLAVEEIFYLVTPLLILLFARFTSRRGTAVLYSAILVSLFCTVARVLSVHFYNPDFDNGVRKIVIFRLDAIMIGVFFAWLSGTFPVFFKEKRKLFVLFFLPVLILTNFYLAYLPTDQLNGSFFARTFLLPLMSLGCVGFMLLGLTFKIPSTVSLIFSRIARWSYSAYFFNIPVAIALDILHPITNGFAMCCLFFAITFLLSYLNYTFFERNFLRYRDRNFPVAL
jgi:peptidoglycan/LPS O-acetylase OafA/YrhL